MEFKHRTLLQLADSCNVSKIMLPRLGARG